MAINIHNPEAHRLARELASLTGETLTEAVVMSLRERLERERARLTRRSMVERLTELAQRCSELEVLDERSGDEILGYGADGAPSHR